MSSQTLQQLLWNEIEALPEPLAEEVLDFVLFVKGRRAEEAFLWSQAQASRAFRREHPDEVETLSAEEWDALTGHLDAGAP
jgi:hypothetical protein